MEDVVDLMIQEKYILTFLISNENTCYWIFSLLSSILPLSYIKGRCCLCFLSHRHVSILLCQVDYKEHTEEKIKFNFTSLWFLIASLFENILTVLQRRQVQYLKDIKVVEVDDVNFVELLQIIHNWKKLHIAPIYSKYTSHIIYTAYLASYWVTLFQIS